MDTQAPTPPFPQTQPPHTLCPPTFLFLRTHRPAGSLRICITGAGGFIASHLAKRLKSEGHYVIACDWKKNEYFKVNLIFGSALRVPAEGGNLLLKEKDP